MKNDEYAVGENSRELTIEEKRDLSCKRQSAGSLTIVGDYEELLRRFCHYRDALDYCLSALKHYHMTRGGISTLIAKTEKIKDRANVKHDLPEKAGGNYETTH